jgi:protein Mpv17
MPSAAGQPGQISVSALFKRVFADQFLFAPLGLALFLVSMAVLEGLDLEGVMDRLNKLYLPILLINWQMCA